MNNLFHEGCKTQTMHCNGFLPQGGYPHPLADIVVDKNGFWGPPPGSFWITFEEFFQQFEIYFTSKRPRKCNYCFLKFQDV